MQLKNLVEEQIPANADALEHARSLGDLRENSEYKFAKEQQSLLGKMRREYESSLVDLRGTDFRDVEVTDTVVLGCAVTVKFSGGRTETYYVLGLLDTVPKRNMISFETPLGKLLIGRKLDERLEMPSGEHGQIVEISPLPQDMIDWFNEEPSLEEA
jgi:transcription elongation GreA/GreB family factor